MHNKPQLPESHDDLFGPEFTAPGASRSISNDNKATIPLGGAEPVCGINLVDMCQFPNTERTHTTEARDEMQYCLVSHAPGPSRDWMASLERRCYL